jgi:hypothetical protein
MNRNAAFDERPVVVGLVRGLRLDGLDPGLQRHRLKSDTSADSPTVGFQQIKDLGGGFGQIGQFGHCFFPDWP